MLFDVSHRLTDGLYPLGLLIGNLTAEHFLKGHNQLDEVKRVSFQILTEAGTGSDFTFVYSQLFYNDCLYTFENVAPSFTPFVWSSDGFETSILVS